ncbi:hypothetical protein BDW69DRAFT_39152 [Aspergillus filifer]
MHCIIAASVVFLCSIFFLGFLVRSLLYFQHGFWIFFNIHGWVDKRSAYFHFHCISISPSELFLFLKTRDDALRFWRLEL